MNTANETRSTPDAEQVAAALAAAGLPVRPCGLNGDWNCSAWHLGPSSEPNRVSGDTFLLDNEDGTFGIVQRFYEADGIGAGDGNDQIVPLTEEGMSLTEAVEQLSVLKAGGVL